MAENKQITKIVDTLYDVISKILEDACNAYRTLILQWSKPIDISAKR